MKNVDHCLSPFRWTNVVFYFSLLAAIFLLWSCEGNHTTEPLREKSLFLKVVDSNVMPVDSAAFHYIFSVNAGSLGKVMVTQPATPIGYEIPGRSFVKIDVYRWYTREFIGTLVNDTLEAGSYAMNISSLNATNGIYIVSLQIADSLSEKICFLCDSDISQLIQRKPLAYTDAQGGVVVPYGLLGFNCSASIKILPEITVVVHKAGRGTVTKSVTVDTTQTTYAQIVL